MAAASSRDDSFIIGHPPCLLYKAAMRIVFGKQANPLDAEGLLDYLMSSVFILNVIFGRSMQRLSSGELIGVRSPSL